MAVITREELQALTAAQEQVREQQSADREKIVKLEGRFEGSAEHWATKADVEKVRTDVEKVRADVEKVRTDVEKVRADVEKVRTDVEKVRTEVAGFKSDVRLWLIGGLVLLAVWDKVDVMWLLRLLAEGGP